MVNHLLLFFMSPPIAINLPRVGAAGIFAVALFLVPAVAAEKSVSPLHHVAAEIDAPVATLPADKRLPFGWAGFPVAHDRPTQVRWSTAGIDANGTAPTRFRLTLALDDRSPRTIDVALAQSGRRVGAFDLRFAHALELFELVLSAEDGAAARREGLFLRLRAAGSPLWLVSPVSAPATCPRELQPHLLMADGAGRPRAEFDLRLASRASVAPFGWMEGCVLDGLRELAAGTGGDREGFARARREHWALFLDGRDRLIYEDPRSGVGDEKFLSIEETLPIADLALWNPRHRVVDLALAYWSRNTRAGGLVYSGGMVSAEGSYTVGYPLAVVGAVRGDRALAEQSLRQLLGRRDRLWHDGALWLRHTDKGGRTFRNWARGVTWHFLGSVRALPHLRAAGVDVRELESEIRRTAEFVRRQQRPDGLWNCFIDDAAGVPDTSGSAGIATALALGARLGVLMNDDLGAARRTLAALETKLTPDGFLTGVAQSNRGGEALQRSDYRVISAMGMGLMAQLIAATR